MHKVSLQDYLLYYLIWIIGWPFYFLPVSIIHKIGKYLGSIAFYCAKKHVKIAMNNLAMVKTFTITEAQMKEITKQSFQNLVITTLEYFKIKQFKNRMSELVTADNAHVLEDARKAGKGVIVVAAHASNWELTFCHYTEKRDAITVGRPIKNTRLYKWILSIRQMHGGRVLETKNAIQEGIKALNAGKLYAIVNDQALPESSYSYPLLGTRAWTSSTPALLAYKTNCPIFVVSIHRKPMGKYAYNLTGPIVPDKSKPLKHEVYRLMDCIMQQQEKNIMAYPGEWLWFHKRWKQEGYDRILKNYKADNYLIVMPEEDTQFLAINAALPLFRKWLKRSFIWVMAPRKYADLINLSDAQIILYDDCRDIFIRDWRFQIIFDFYGIKSLKKHFLKLGAWNVFSLKDLKQDSNPIEDYSAFFSKTLCFS